MFRLDATDARDIPSSRPIEAAACPRPREPTMKAVILAGGLGTRISEETVVRPKPMVEIGGKPILWHIMKSYSAAGIHEFVVCCGYKGYLIKEYFANYFLHMSDVTFDMRTQRDGSAPEARPSRGGSRWSTRASRR